MKKEFLDEREFELVNIIGAKLGSNQRILSQKMNLSLGMVNMLIRRLISKGFIRIEQLNKRKVQYILTPKGFAEKMRKSVRYTIKTLNSISLINDNLMKRLAIVVKDGARHFYILGDSDFSRLVEKMIKELSGGNCSVFHIQEVPSQKVDGMVLICKEGFFLEKTANQNNFLNLIEGLAMDDNLLNSIV